MCWYGAGTQSTFRICFKKGVKAEARKAKNPETTWNSWKRTVKMASNGKSPSKNGKNGSSGEPMVLQLPHLGQLHKPTPKDMPIGLFNSQPIAKPWVRSPGAPKRSSAKIVTGAQQRSRLKNYKRSMNIVASAKS